MALQPLTPPLPSYSPPPPPSALTCLSACFLWRIHFQQFLALQRLWLITGWLGGLRESLTGLPHLLPPISGLLGAPVCSLFCPIAELALNVCVCVERGYLHQAEDKVRWSCYTELSRYTTASVLRTHTQKNPCKKLSPLNITIHVKFPSKFYSTDFLSQNTK